MNEKISDMRQMELKLLIIEYNKASQLDRSFSKTKLSPEKKIIFRERLLEYCILLMEKIDNGTLKNRDIREKIKELTNIDTNNISFGQAQKVINVSLKQYCFIVNAKKKLLEELDCPLDTKTMDIGATTRKSHGIKHGRMIKVDEKDYVKYQDIFYEHEGMRILKDRSYDGERIENFLNLK